MALDYRRSFTVGRGSEQLLNEDIHKVVESIRHMLSVPEGNAAMPEGFKLHGSLWLDLNKNELNYYHREQNTMVNVFADKFCITDHLMDDLPPADPVPGTLWISNGALTYFDGSVWGPIKAITEDGSQFNLAAFEDFSLISPLQPASNTVIDDANNTEAAELFKAAVIEGRLDPENNSQWLETDEKFGPNWTLAEASTEYAEPPTIPPDVMCQFVVPNSSVGRFFVNGLYEPNTTKINGICLQYPKLNLVDKVPSFVHVNPTKVSQITKRIFKINKENPRISLSAHNTEFYGYRKDSPFGIFLRPGADQDHGDYITVPEGINLNYNTSQNFDYILAVIYSFSWVRSTGRMSVSDSADNASSYFLSNYGGPLNVFVEGYNLENDAFDYDSESGVINFDDDVTDLEISVLQNAKHEYGFIREVTLDGRGIIKLLNQYVQPLVFINGEAVHPSFNDVEIDGDKIYITGAHRNMSWSVIELNDIIKNDDMFYAASTVEEADNVGNGRIHYDPALITADDDIVLFVDGMLVKKEDIIRNAEQQYITTPGLVYGQEYILLKDKYHHLYAENLLIPAFKTGKIDDSLVYLNGRLLCNDAAFVTTSDKSAEAATAVNGELRLFLTSALDRTVGEYAIWDSYNNTWQPMDVTDQTALMAVIKSYENSLRAVKLGINYDPSADKMMVYAFNYASSIDYPLVVRSEDAQPETKDFAIGNTYAPGKGALSVWIDGVRQYHINEWVDGAGFSLAEPVSGAYVRDENGEVVYDNGTGLPVYVFDEYGNPVIDPETGLQLTEIDTGTGLPERYGSKITYCIESPEKGQTNACIREVLTLDNLVDGARGVYKTMTSLYPGRVTLYIGGLRQPKESWTILDNNTIVLKSQTTQLIGSPDNFPTEQIADSDGDIKTITRVCSDEILVEVRQEFQRKERTIVWTDTNNWDIDAEAYDLPLDILEAKDEIMIFVDGIYTGLRANEGYRIDRAKGCITILSGEVVEKLCVDELAVFFATHPDKAALWQEKHDGIPYSPNVRHIITLEWR